MSVVVANYGLPGRNLGAVSVLGPVRMDYPRAIASVRQAAPELSRFVGELYRTMKRDPYEVLGVSRDADERDIKKSFRSLARELHPDVNRHDPEAEEKFKEAAEAYEILSDAERRSVYDRYGHDGLSSSGYASNVQGGFGSFSDIFDAFFGGGDPFGARRPAGAAQGGDVAVAVEITLEEAATGRHEVEVEYEAVDRCEHCNGNGAEPGTPIETCPRCQGTGQLQSVSRTAFGQLVRTHACDAAAATASVPKEPCHVCGGRGRQAGARTLDVDIPAGIADEQRIRAPGAATRASAAARPATSTCSCASREDERFVRDGNDLITVVDLPAPRAALGTKVTRADARRRRGDRRSRPAPSRARSSRCAGAACRRCAAAAAATSAWW